MEYNRFKAQLESLGLDFSSYYYGGLKAPIIEVPAKKGGLSDREVKTIVSILVICGTQSVASNDAFEGAVANTKTALSLLKYCSDCNCGSDDMFMVSKAFIKAISPLNLVDSRGEPCKERLLELLLASLSEVCIEYGWKEE